MTEKEMLEKINQVHKKNGLPPLEDIEKMYAAQDEEPQTFTIKVPVKEYWVYQQEYSVKASSEAEALMKFHEYWDAGWDKKQDMENSGEVEDLQIYEELYQHNDSGDIVDVDDIEVCVDCDGSEY